MDQEETKVKEERIKSNLEQSQRLEEGLRNYHTQSGRKIRVTKLTTKFQQRVAWHQSVSNHEIITK